MSKIAISLIALLIGGGALLWSMKVPTANQENTITISGTVIDIYEGGVKDVVFKLEGDDNTYYINRGFENGLKLSQLMDKYINSNMSLTYVEHNHLLKPLLESHHLAKVEAKNSIVYNEMNQ